MSASPRIVCVVGVPRTGSNRVIHTLEGFEGLSVRGEIFNPDGVANIGRADQAFVRSLTPELLMANTEDLARWVRANPGRVLDKLTGLAGERVLAFKLLPGELANQQVEAVLSRSDIAVLLLWRRPIDIYISREKVGLLRHWNRVDTSDLVIEADVGAFLRMCRDWHLWYRLVLRVMREKRIRFCEIDYSTALSEESLAALLQIMLARMGTTAGRWQKADHTMFKQDRETDYARKVSNWEPFIEEIRRRGFEAIAFADRGLA